MKTISILLAMMFAFSISASNDTNGLKAPERQQVTERNGAGGGGGQRG